MATSKEFHDYVMEQLSRAGDVSSRKMMGEYCLYYCGKVIGLICDGTVFLKPTPTVLRLMPEAERDYPYEGSKTLMVIADEIENTELFRELLPALFAELPEPAPKKAKKL